MKTYLVLFFSTISFIGFSNTYPLIDTISNWQVYNGGVLLKAMNIHNQGERIILTKGKIRAVDVFSIHYSDDTPCFDCTESITIRTQKGKVIRTLYFTKSNYSFDIKTVDLQVLTFKNKSEVLKFYYKEDSNNREIFLFEVQIK